MAAAAERKFNNTAVEGGEKVAQNAVADLPPAVTDVLSNSGTPPTIQREDEGVTLSSSVKGGQTSYIVQNIFNCCALQNADWLKIFAMISLIVSVALIAFLACYTAGLFHFEKFIGPIGSSVSLGAAGILFVLSGVLLYLLFKDNQLPGQIQRL